MFRKSPTASTMNIMYGFGRVKFMSDLHLEFYPSADLDKQTEFVESLTKPVAPNLICFFDNRFDVLGLQTKTDRTIQSMRRTIDPQKIEIFFDRFLNVRASIGRFCDNLR